MKLCFIGGIFAIILVAEGVDVKADTEAPKPSGPDVMLNLMYPYRREKKNYNSITAPCGNAEKGKPQGNYLPSKYLTVGIKAVQDSANVNCTIRLGTGTDLDESFIVLKPINVPNTDGVFNCGNSSKSTEQIITKIPDDYKCDSCTLQLIWETEQGPRYQCSDIIIYAKSKPECAQPCQNNGVCIEGICSCVEDFYGDYCEFKKVVPVPKSYCKWIVLLLILLGLIVSLWALVTYLRNRIKINRYAPPKKGYMGSEAPPLTEKYEGSKSSIPAGQIGKNISYANEFDQH